LIAAANGFKQQEDFKLGEKFKVLKPNYLKDIVYG